MTIAEMERQLHSLVSRVSRRETRVVLEQDGAPVAAIVSAEDFRRLARLDREQREAFEVLEAMRAPFRDVPPEEIERETDRIFEELREEDRRKRQGAAIGR